MGAHLLKVNARAPVKLNEKKEKWSLLLYKVIRLLSVDATKNMYHVVTCDVAPLANHT